MALYDFCYANINLHDNFFALAFKNKKNRKDAIRQDRRRSGIFPRKN
jgi:hypothetical protein